MTTEQALYELGKYRMYATDDDVREVMQIAIDALTWIPVSERLPKDGQHILVCTDGIKYKIHSGYYSGEDEEGYRFHAFEKGAWYHGVTHWMKLPQPPKEEK